MGSQTIEPRHKINPGQIIKSIQNVSAVERLKNQWGSLTNWISKRTVSQVAILFLVIALLLGIGGYINQHALWKEDESVEVYKDNPFLGDFYANLSSKLASIAITILIIDSLYKRRQDEELKAQLIRQMGSKHPDIAVTAALEMTAQGKNPGKDNNWLTDGSLRKVNLKGANLQNAKLFKADLTEVNMYDANLREASLTGANLQKANLRFADLRKASLAGADLRKADLWGADLRGAILWEAHLEEAILIDTKLQGSDFMNANLQGIAHLTESQLRQIEILDGATMPDGVKLKHSGIRYEGFKYDGPTLDEWLKKQFLKWLKEEYIPNLYQEESLYSSEPQQITTTENNWHGAKVW